MMNLFRRYPHGVMALLILLAGLATIIWGERVTVADGYGWDGKFYGALTKNFYNEVFVHHMDMYHTQRIVPSGIVHYSLRGLGMPLDDIHIIYSFEAFDLCMLLLCCLFWKLIADRLSLSVPARWLGFLGLFVNVAVLKIGFFLPVMTDSSGMMLGLALVYFFLKDDRWGLFVTTLIGAFIWPTVIYGGFLLLAMPRTSVVPNLEKRSLIPIIVAAAASSGMLAVIAYLYFHTRARSVGWGGTDIDGTFVYLSMFLAFAYTFVATKILFQGVDTDFLKRALKSVRWTNVFLAIVAFAIAKGSLALMADPHKHAYDAWFTIKTTALRSIARPLVFLIAHVIYFGPIVLLTVFLWRPLCRIVGTYGPGLMLVVLMNILLSLGSESRQSINGFAVLLVFTVLACERLKLHPAFLWVFAAVSLIFSKVWLPFNNPNVEGNFLQFPAQYFFMNSGPFMIQSVYLIHGAAVLLTGVGLYYYLKRISGQREPTHRISTQLDRPVTAPTG